MTFYTDNVTISYSTKVKEPNGFDPITGEPLFEISETVDSFRASLEADSVESALGILPGDDKQEHFYTGRTKLKPDEMPSWYVPTRIVDLKFDNQDRTFTGYVYYEHPGRLNLDGFFGTRLAIVINY